MSEVARMRAALEKQFVSVVVADFNAEGVKAIAALREKDLSAYARVVKSVCPDAPVEPAKLDELSDDEVSALLYATQEARRVGASADGGSGAPGDGEQVEGLPAIPETEDVP